MTDHLHSTFPVGDDVAKSERSIAFFGSRFRFICEFLDSLASGKEILPSFGDKYDLVWAGVSPAS